MVGVKNFFVACSDERPALISYAYCLYLLAEPSNESAVGQHAGVTVWVCCVDIFVKAKMGKKWGIGQVVTGDSVPYDDFSESNWV